MATMEQEFKEAFARHQAGDLGGAEGGYRRILRDRPQHPEALYLLGSLHAQRLEYAEAVPLLERAIALDPQPRFLNNLGIALKETGRSAEAEAAYGRALAQQPGYPEALNNWGILCKDAGRRDEAIAWFRRAVQARPGYADAHNNLGITLQKAEEYEEAAEHFRQAVALLPNFAAAHNNLGAVLRLLGRLDEVAPHVERALALQPDYPEALNNWGIVLHEQRRHAEAEVVFRRALALCPGYADALLNLGGSVQSQGRADEALECFHRVIALEPDRLDAHFNRALVWLMQGDMGRGWEEYEWRLRDPKKKMAHTHPLWDGSPLAGRTLLVHAEQGFGDTFHFVRYLRLIEKDGGRVVFECQPRTKSLLERCEGFDEIVERPESNETQAQVPHDVQIPLMSLPRLFPHPADAPPCPAPYVHVAPETLGLWRERLDEISAAVPGHQPGNLKVGLVWAGNPNHKNDKNRSASLADFAPLAQVPGVTLYSLQKGPAEAQAAEPPAGMTLVDLSGALDDFADTAAVIMHLDVVIAVDTSTAHLAGALGRPVWLLVPFAPEWRWGLAGEHTPWYPAMRLFRQAALHTWAPVITRITQALAQRAGAAEAALSVGADAPTPPLISVLMCTYNRLDLLPRVLDSYARQTLPPNRFEVILVDDASTDGTREFVEAYQPPYRLTYHRQERNRGIGAARRQTVALARGEVVLFADDDETARPDYLEQHLRTHRAHPQEDHGAHGRIELAPEVADSVTMQMLTGSPGLYHYFDNIPDGQVLDFRFFWTNVVSVKRSFLLKHEPFDDSTRAQEDVEMGWRLGRSGLVLVHNRDAVMDTLRRMTYEQFCRRQDRIGSATAWLARKHGDSGVPFWIGVADVEANLSALKEQYDRADGVEEQIALLEAAGWQAVNQLPNFLTHTLPKLTTICKERAAYLFLAAYVRQMREYHAQEAANPVVPASEALVSVVLTGQGGPRAVAQATEDLRAQTYPHWELLAADAGEDACAARQRAMTRARGEFILFLDSDDHLLPTFLAECVALLERTPALSFAYGDWERRTDAGETDVLYAKDYRVAPEMEYLGLPPRPCAVFRRPLWEDAGGWPAEDGSWDFWLAAAEKGHTGRRIPKPLARSAKAEGGGDAPKDALDRARLALRHPALFGQSSLRKARGLVDAEQWLSEGRRKAAPPTALVSVVLTARDVRGMGQALQGLMAQTYPQFELVIVNATGSALPRHTVRQIRQSARAVDVPRHTPPGAARSAGIGVATGKYLTYLEDSAFLGKDHLKTLVTALEHTEYRVAFTGAAPEVGGRPQAAGFDYDHIFLGNSVPPSCLMHDASCLAEVGGFDPALTHSDDWDLWIRLSRKFDFLHLPLGTCRIPGDTEAQVSLDEVRAVETIYRKHNALLPDAALFVTMQQAVLSQMQARVAQSVPAVSVDAEVTRAEGLFQAGDTSAAERLLRDLDRDFPGRPRVLNNLGVLAWNRARTTEALHHFQKALEADPANAAARANCEAAIQALQAAGQTEVGSETGGASAPLISVLMCTHNRLDLLPRVLDSYARQTLPPNRFEVILVDDASTDGTREFVEAYQAPHALTYHRQERNQGIAVGRNQALALARGGIVLFADDDETARPDYLEQHLKTHQAHPQETVAVCGRVELGEDAARSLTMHILTGSPGLYHFFGDLKADQVYDFRRFWGNVISAKRGFLVRHGGFDAETQAQEDVELGWRLHPHGLTVIHNPQAVLDTLRVMTLDQFYRRQARIGAASAWLTRKHPHPDVPHWLGITDAEVRLPILEQRCRATEGLTAQVDTLERAGWEVVSRTPGFREQVFATLSAMIKERADFLFLSSYAQRLQDYQAEDDRRSAPAPSATVHVILTGPEPGTAAPAPLESLLAQTYPHWDLTVIARAGDGADAARALVAAHPQRPIRLLVSQPDERPSEARNRAVAAADGKYLLCLCGLDELLPTFLAECVGLLERAPEISLAYTDAVSAGQVLFANDYRLVPHPHQPGLPPNTGVVFRRAAWEQVGGWNDSANAAWEFWRACGESGHLGRRIPRPLLRQGLPATTADFAAEVARAEGLFQAGDPSAAERLLRDLDRDFPGQPRVLNNLGVLAWSGGDRVQALRHFRDALEASPQDRTTLLNCADALQALGRREDAARLLGGYARQRPKDEAVRRALAALHGQSNLAAKAA